ncbi:MAG: hypothetical protein SV487_00685 [Thermodesulfobacteriota bacterium]|nr:hypothetical protein [Thermodesulfobacteriota bacterium]
MTAQNVLIAGVIALVLAGILGFANVYMVKPGMNPDMPTVEPLPPVGGQAVAVDPSIVSATMGQIKSVKSKGGFQDFEARHVDRNPFLWPGEGRKKEGVADEFAKAEGLEAAEEEPAVVTMILIGQNKKMAVINDEFVSGGDKFEGKRISRIVKNAVFIRGESGEKRVPLSAMSFAYLKEKMEKEKQEAAKAAAEKEAVEGLEAGGGPKGALTGTPSAAQVEAVNRLMQRLQPLLGGAK